MAPEILVINGSPRPEGNSAFLAARCGEVFAGLGRSWEQVDLRKLKIGPCRACGQCREGRGCIQKDDMAPLYPKLAQCKALLLVSPVYWFTYTGQLKTFVDRLCGLWNQDKGFLARKPVGAALVYADADVYESGAVNAIASFEHMFRFLEADLRGFAYGTAGAPGDAAQNPDLLERTRKLALALCR
jgi:multimeric flavodoxin WrbA